MHPVGLRLSSPDRTARLTSLRSSERGLERALRTGWSGYARVSGFDPPEDDARGDPVFAGAVVADDGDSSLRGDEVEHFELLGVGLAGVGERVGDDRRRGSSRHWARGGTNALRAAALVDATAGVAAFVRLGAMRQRIPGKRLMHDIIHNSRGYGDRGMCHRWDMEGLQ